MRYLECALVQAASLRFNDADCDLALVTNVGAAERLGHRGRRLLERLQSFDVEILHADYTHEPRGPIGWFHASCYVFDAIAAAASAGPPDRRLWLTDVDCVWLAPTEVLAALPHDGRIGCIPVGYDIDWDPTGKTRGGFEALRAAAGTSAESSHPPGAGGQGDDPGGRGARSGDPGGRSGETQPRWIGGELLAGSARDLLALVGVCEQLGDELRRLDLLLGTEEQLLTLADALGRVAFADLRPRGRRIWTGPRHEAANPSDPCALGLWHLPSEKGLGFRRAANAILADRTRALRRDLAEPTRAMRRFNVQGGKWTPRRVRDDGWLVANRAYETALDRFSRVRPASSSR